MLKRDKERIVSELTERLRGAQTLIVTDYRGLSVTDIDELRTKLLEHGVRYTVVKNTLTKLAAEQAGSKDLLELIDGPTAIAFLGEDADPAAAAKVLNEAASVGRVLVIRGGLLEGQTITEADVKTLASLPPTDVLRAQLAGALVAPMATIVGLFDAPLRDLVNVLDARIKQLEEQGDGAAEEQPQPEAAAEPEPEPDPEPEAEAGQLQPEAEAAEPEPEQQPETEAEEE